MALSLASATLSFAGPVVQAPAVQRASTVTMQSTSGLSWVTPGEGKVWDPLGLAKTPEKFERLRYVEVKHGRIAMLAVTGHVVAASGARFGGELANGLKFADVKGSGYAALSQLSTTDLAIIFLSIGFLEMRVMKVAPGSPKPAFPGDLRNGLYNEGWDMLSPAEQKSKMSKELNNGRAAMMGIFGLMVHEAIDGKPYIINEMLGMGQPY